MTAINFTERHNVRFWVWLNDGWVKLTLRPGQELNWAHGGPHEEGWSYTGEVWHYDEEEGCVFSSVATNACDCDGRLDSYWQGVSREYDDEFEDPDTGVPYRRLRFEKVSSGQRDYAAEAAGY